MLRQSYKKNKNKNKKTKILIKGSNLRVPQLVFLPELGSKDRRVTPRREPDSHPSLVGLRKAGYQSNNIGPGLEVICCASKGMTLVHMNDVVSCEP